jgi:predicted PurR-regulated permease PerM
VEDSNHVAAAQLKSASSASDRPRQLTAAKAILLSGLGILLYFAHAAFIPIAMALLFALILSAPVEALHKLRIPRSVSASFILVLVLGVMAGAVDILWTPTQQWLASAPRTMAIIKQKITPVAKYMNRLEELRKNADGIGMTSRSAAPPTALVAQNSTPTILDATREALVGVLTFVILTLFLLAGGPPMLARMTAAFVDDLNAAHVLYIIEKVRAEVGLFYVTTAVINFGLGCATAAAMMAWGMPTPYLWGTAAALLNFIPYAGSATTLVILTVVAVVSFNSLGHILGVAGTYVAIAALEGQVIQPLLVGRRLEINPLWVFLSLWFGGLFWGIAGVVLATPMLVALKVVAENARSGRAMMEFLGPNNQAVDRDKTLREFARNFE